MFAHREPARRLLSSAWTWRAMPLLGIVLLALTTEVVVATAPATVLLAAAVPAPDPRVLKEVGKQTVEQPLHFLMAAAPICLSRSLAGVPWYGWAITPLLAYREWSQWPSKRWWDPPLDWAFMTLGVVVATWRRGGRRPAGRPPQSSSRPPSHPLRRKYPSRPAATASIRASANG